MSRIKAIAPFGQQIWLDNLTRQLLDSGELSRWIAEDAIAGVTSNPAIFHNAIRDDAAYRAALAPLKALAADPSNASRRGVAGHPPRLRPVRADPCGVRRPGRFRQLRSRPALADDAAGTLAEARRLWAAIDRPNAMIKIPATPAGLDAITGAIADGINVNVTLIFGPAQLAAVQAAHRAGIERAVLPRACRSTASRRSPASSSAARQPARPAVAGRVAGPHGDRLRARRLRPLARPAGAARRRPAAAVAVGLDLDQEPGYRDVIYVEQLIGADTVNTVPDATLAAFRDHGEAAATLAGDPAATADTSPRWPRSASISTPSATSCWPPACASSPTPSRNCSACSTPEP
jgi:transaldolase